MSASDLRTARSVYLVLAVTFGLIAAFWAVYSVRLLVVTHGLQAIRPGGRGAYVGAAVFPVLAIACAWLSVRWFRRARRLTKPER